MAESLPPMTVSDLLTALDNPHFKSYLYFGGATDKGWKVAIGVQKFSQGLRSYRISTSGAAEVKKKLKVTGSPKGVVCDFGRKVKAKLTKAQSENALTVLDKVSQA